MIPNWLLGKSKSKLQEILGGGGGGTSYTAGDGIDISNGVISFDPETTPAIDPSKIDGLDDDLAILAPKTAISNPNILHNPWFTVNQRGVTSVTTSNGFIADRWRVWSNIEFTATRNSNGFIVIDNSSGNDSIILYQTRTTSYLTSLLGNKLTASILLSDGTIYSGTITYDGSSKNYVDNEHIRLYAPSSATNQILGFSVKPGASVTIKALKLEVGEISTLHLDPRPEYALELAKCQRYFIRYANDTQYSTHTAIGVAQTVTNIFVDLVLPSQMRTKPTLSAPSIKVEAPGTATVSGTPSISFGAALMNNIARLTITGLTNLTVGSPYYFIISAGSYMDFDAEL